MSNKYQDMLLYGCLAEAYGYLKGTPDMIQYYEANFKGLYNRTRSNNKVVDDEMNGKMELFDHLLNLNHHQNTKEKYKWLM